MQGYLPLGRFNELESKNFEVLKSELRGSIQKGIDFVHKSKRHLCCSFQQALIFCNGLSSNCYCEMLSHVFALKAGKGTSAHVHQFSLRCMPLQAELLLDLCRKPKKVSCFLVLAVHRFVLEL